MKTDAFIPNLSKIQKYVTLENGTEPPFQNAYWDHFKEGIYVDILTGTPLFSSRDKFESQCGWPSFSKPISMLTVRYLPDNTLNRFRIEVRSTESDAHLGHVFEDGPEAKGGLRYCINSAALRFIPKEEMAAQGYETFLDAL